MTALTAYMDAWVRGDVEAIVRLVSADCGITECYGPVYRGRDTVRRWASAWFAAGGIVYSWVLTDHFRADDREVGQWVFEVTWGGGRSSFEGATIARTRSGLIVDLREYETSAPLYDWTGTWR